MICVTNYNLSDDEIIFFSHRPSAFGIGGYRHDLLVSDRYQYNPGIIQF